MKRVLFTAVLLITSVTLSQAEDVLAIDLLTEAVQPAPLAGLIRIERAVPPPVVADDLPPAASALLKTFDQESEQIRARIEAEIAAKREVLIQQLQAMQDGYTREAKLDEAVAIREAIRKLRRSGMTVLSYPNVQGGYGGLTTYRGQNGKVLHFEVVGSNSGSIYGTDIYTDDSDLSTVAVHAGLLKVGEMGVVKVTILPSQASHSSSTRHGITSSAWSQYPGSYKVEPIPGGSRAVATASTARPDPGSLWSYEKHVGQSFEFQVTGSTSGGSIWGTGIYTGDSRLSVAAVHAGLLRDGESGVVKVTILAGDSRYLGSSRHGISSYDYGPYPFSYRVDSTTTNQPSNVVPRLFLNGPGGIRLRTSALGSLPYSVVTPGAALLIEEAIEIEEAKPRLSTTPSLPSSGPRPATVPQ
ncbi:MAG: LCCL domain-containing protein [Planctomycetota bacterium]